MFKWILPKNVAEGSEVSPLCSNRGIREDMSVHEKTLEITYAQAEGIGALLEAAGQRSEHPVLFFQLSL